MNPQKGNNSLPVIQTGILLKNLKPRARTFVFVEYFRAVFAQKAFRFSRYGFILIVGFSRLFSQMETCILLFQNSDGGCGMLFSIVFVIVVIVAVAMHYTNKQKQEELARAEGYYRGLLQQLKRTPTNADLKEKTLAAGRVYSNLTRDKKGVTVYDEMALMNDINAACAAAMTSFNHAPRPVAAPAPESRKQTIEERLQKLESLKNSNLISESEYESRRTKILDEI